MYVNLICTNPTQITKYFGYTISYVVKLLFTHRLPSHSNDPFYWQGLTLTSAWISNHMPGKGWDENTVAPLKFRNGLVISSHTL